MRTEREMMDLILSVAENDDRIRAVYMNGSRANPNVSKDDFRDYDIVFAVTETEPFLAVQNWIAVFGETTIVQEPDLNDISYGITHDCLNSYTWLMLFKDGNRIDLRIITIETATEDFLSGTLAVKLLDKNNFLPGIPAPDDSGYFIKHPSAGIYHACCNNFWWCLNNVAKGIARKQLPYAMRMYSEVVHAELEKMTEWHIGMNHDFSVTTGMWGKYFEKYLPQELYARYKATYSDGNYEHLKAAVYTACGLFHELAAEVGEKLGFSYRQDEEDGIREYLGRLFYNNIKNGYS